MRVRFSGCVLDSDQHTLLCNDASVALTPKAFALLAALVAAYPAAVRRETLYERLWPEINVDPGNLHSLIAEIRAAIGDRERKIIRTVHRVGYALGGDLIPLVPAATFTAFLMLGSRELPLLEGVNVIGRSNGIQVALASDDVSRRHARITVSAESVSIEDIGSKHGTWVNGERISAPRILRDDDQIIVGRTMLRFRVRRSGKSTASLGSGAKP